MPQISFVSVAQQKMVEPAVKSLHEINTLLRKAKKLKNESGTIKIPKINLGKAVMVAFSDSAFATCRETAAKQVS